MSAAETLRAAIEASLRARHAGAVSIVASAEDAAPSCAAADVDDWRTLTTTDHHPTALDALRALALACGLRDDGSDPLAEIERLRAVIADALAHLSGVHATDCEGGYSRCACDVEKARMALAKAGAQ